MVDFPKPDLAVASRPLAYAPDLTVARQPVAGAPPRVAAGGCVGWAPAVRSAAPRLCQVAPAAPAAPAKASEADRAYARIKVLLNDSDGDVTHADLMEIGEIFAGLPAGVAREVFDRLSAQELSTWQRELHSGAWFGFGGLSLEERRGLMETLARKLSGEQLAKLAASVCDYEDKVALGEAVAQYGSNATKLAFIKAMAPRTVEGESSRLEAHIGVSEMRRGDPDAIAVGAVLASLSGRNFNVAFYALDDAQVVSVMQAAAGERFINVSIGQGAGSMHADHEPSLLVAIVKAAAGAYSPDVKAKVFAAAAKPLKEIKEAGSFGIIALDKKADAMVVSDAMTELLLSDTERICSWLSEQVDSYGKAYSVYAHVMIDQGRADVLGSVIGTIQRGAGGAGDPIARFESEEPGTTGQRHHALAKTLGYVTGGTIVGIRRKTDDIKAQAEEVAKIFDFALDLVPIPGPDVTKTITKTFAKEAAEAAIEAEVDALRSGNRELEEVMLDLAFPRTADGARYTGPADTPFKTSCNDVITRNRDS